MEDYPSTKNSKTMLIMLLTMIVIIAGVGVFFVYSYTDILGYGDKNQGDTKLNNNTTLTPIYTSEYTNITNAEAYNKWLNDNDSIYFIDIRPCSCSYNNEHIIDAYLISHFEDGLISLFNTTKNLVFYDWNTDTSNVIDYCETMLNHTYGGIYYLQDGYNAWKKAGYPTE